MARGITQAQVNHAADALLQRGIRPTIEKLRAELGTGSPNTLTRMVEVWWAQLAERLAALARADLPGVPEPVQQAMQALWTDAVVAARQGADARILAREQQADATKQACEARLAEMTSAVEASENRRAAAEAALGEERRRAAELQTALADALRSVKDAQGTLEALRHRADEERAQLRADIERATVAEARWLRELDRAREDAKAAAREAKTAHTALAREKFEKQRLARDLVTEKRNARARIAAAKLARRGLVPARKPPRRRPPRGSATSAD